MYLAVLQVFLVVLANEGGITAGTDVPASHLRARVQALASVHADGHDSALQKQLGPSQCVPAVDESKDALWELATSNCWKVTRADDKLEALLTWHGAAVQDSWHSRLAQAKQLCKESREQLPHDAQWGAMLALRAWGEVLMQGRECCDSVNPPFCRSSSTSRLGHLAPFALCLICAYIVFVSPCLCKRSTHAPSHMLLDARRPLDDRCEDGCMEEPTSPPDFPAVDFCALEMDEGWALPRDLQAHWLERSSLRVLPNADQWAKSTATLFAALGMTFGFQEDSVRNQFEHMLSLWRSQVSIVADRVYEGRTYQRQGHSCNNAAALERLHQTILRESLAEVHGDLLHGMRKWRDRCRDCDALNMPNVVLEAGVPQLAGAPWKPQSNECRVSSRDLPEVAMFLLVWAEAGNLRFMPELIYLIAEFALASRPAAGGHIYSPLETHRSGAFLTHVVRPIYAVVFNENYQCVAVKPDGKDKQELKDECKKFMPADCVNYDDWNELFFDPPRMAEALVLKDGRKLFSLPHSERFHALPYVDWASSLTGAKTHREVHSIWAVFVATHRVWFIHLVLYALAVWWVSTSDYAQGTSGTKDTVSGNTAPVRLASACLVVPFFAFCWKFARWFVAGVSLRRKKCKYSFCGFLLSTAGFLARLLFWSTPLITYAAVRYIESLDYRDEEGNTLNKYLWAALGVHYAISLLDALIILFFPGHKEDYICALTPVPIKFKCIRYMFWIGIFAAKFFIGRTTVGNLKNTVTLLNICQPGQQTPFELSKFVFSPGWDKDILKLSIMYGTGLLLFTTDTLFYVLFACTILGLIIGLWQRQWRICRLTFEDAVARIPERFSEKVLFYADAGSTMALGSGGARCSSFFPAIWDRAVEFLRYEDKIDDLKVGDMLFDVNKSCSNIHGAMLQGKIRWPQRVRVPLLFQQPLACTERCIRRDLGILQDASWKLNAEVQWRLTTLARALTLDMPRPFRAPFFPGITVLIPHYADSIHTLKKELCNPDANSEDIVPLMSWLSQRYEGEFEAFSVRMKSRYDTGTRTSSFSAPSGWPSAGMEWAAYSPEQWEKLCAWASMRSQTLWRTVAGMTLYHQVLDCHWEIQRERKTPLSDEGVWDPSELFSCIVSMQLYASFNADQLKHTNKMLEKFPRSLKIAFIDSEQKGSLATLDKVHPKQERRYFSCLIDKTCPIDADGRRDPKLRIELPGFPILGDGKGDNQNHAIPFTRGSIIQCIDANQGAYFEQLLLLPCALAEFRVEKSQGNRQQSRNSSRGRTSVDREGMKRLIVGFPEHITSDIGSIGDFAASAETAFGTLLQRSYAVLGARMHYGHPDMMNKAFMIQQGGVSKATKTVNLSEDIFAGMDFTLRGEGRKIKHAEYFHLAKGRDLGFNTVLTFFSKLSAGTGEQLLTRQYFRLGHVMGVAEFFGFYYAHGGFYLTQFFLSKSVPLLVLLWLLILLDDAEQDFTAPQGATSVAGAEIMAQLLSGVCSWVIALFIAASMAPLFAEVWLQQGFCAAIVRIVKQILTLAPLHFIFQAKIIGVYISNEIRYGGAAYLPTGRGLPTDRRPFIAKGGGLYLDWAQNSFYDGFRLLIASALVGICGGLHVSDRFWRSLMFWCGTLALTIISWLYAPFLFNPYQFAHRYFWKDLKDWHELFLSDHGRHWREWYEQTQLKAQSGLRGSVLDILAWSIFVCCWLTVLQSTMHILSMILPVEGSLYVTRTFAVLPPVACSLLFCLVLPAVLKCRSRKPHLAAAALGVSVLDVIETLVKLRELLIIGWLKSFTAGLVLNYAMLSLLLAAAECTFRFKCSPPSSALGKVLADALKLWLQAHRMAFDMIVSSFIFWTLAPGVAYDRLRSVICYSCSIHQLLVFRDPWGHLARAEAQVGIRDWSREISMPRSFFSDDVPDRQRTPAAPGG